MKQQLNGVQTALQAIAAAEKIRLANYGPSVEQNRAFYLDRLSNYRQLLKQFGNTKDPAEKRELKIIREQVRMMEKGLFKNRYVRLARRVFRIAGASLRLATPLAKWVLTKAGDLARTVSRRKEPGGQKELSHQELARSLQSEIQPKETTPTSKIAKQPALALKRPARKRVVVRHNPGKSLNR